MTRCAAPSFALLAAVVLLAGCGTLTIDVDVYKGPLSLREGGARVKTLEALIRGTGPFLAAYDEEKDEGAKWLVDYLSGDFRDATGDGEKNTCDDFGLTCDVHHYIQTSDCAVMAERGIDKKTAEQEGCYELSWRNSKGTVVPNTKVAKLKESLSLLELTNNTVEAGQRLILLSRRPVDGVSDADRDVIRAYGDSIQAVSAEIYRDAVVETLRRGTKDAEEQEAHRIIRALCKEPAPKPIGLDARLALDRLIMCIDYQHIALQAGIDAPPEPEEGSSDAEPGASHRDEDVKEALAAAQRFENAREAAYERRAKMASLHPASAYLRTSHNEFLRESGRYKKNLLDEQLDTLVPDWIWQIGDEDVYEQLRDADAQSWQNVNRVRVTGVGRTNYVVAKDDTGNWYVKNYSTNVDEIVGAAQSLALFGAGGALGADLVNLPTEGAPTEAQLEAAAEGTRESAQYARLLQHYRDETRDERAQLQAAIGALPALLEGLLEPVGHADALGETAAALDPAARALEGDAPESVHAASDEIREAIRNLTVFHAAAATAVRARTRAALVGADEAEVAEARRREEQALAALRHEVGGLALEATRRRLRAVDAYRTALSVLGDLEGSQL